MQSSSLMVVIQLIIGKVFGSEDNISKALSQELPNIAVQGNRGFGSKWNEPFGFRIGKQTHVTGFPRTYLNGIEK